MSEQELLGRLRIEADKERHALEDLFLASGDIMPALEGRAALADRTINLLAQDMLPGSGATSHALVAIGGYGRRHLFPCSDLDLLLLCPDSRALEALREPAAVFVRHLWDLGWRAAVTSRLLPQCRRLEWDNPEFTISLLDSRFVSGDLKLYSRLRDEALGDLARRDGRSLREAILDATKARHAKHGETLYQLEPDLKEAPGGLRDFDVACWLVATEELSRRRGHPAPAASWPQVLGEAAGRSFRFIASARAFLHIKNGRDDNRLTYDLQEEAAKRAIGLPKAGPQPVEAWMRDYFRHARTIARVAKRFLDEAADRGPTLKERFGEWRQSVSREEFQVRSGRLVWRLPASLASPATLFKLLENVAEHGRTLSGETEASVETALKSPPYTGNWASGSWPELRRILTLPYSATALRTMHELGVLEAILPEFRAIDALVIRDLYHRYTVDEHTLRTTEALQELKGARATQDRPFAELLNEVEQPELLLLALLLHDVGKSQPGPDHTLTSREIADKICKRIGLPEDEAKLVDFLISSHLEMSRTLQRRDIFDPETVDAFAERVGTVERLRMLCLLTYVDVKSVNPEALTTWKAETLWQLYAATANHLARSLDARRLRPTAEEALAEMMRTSPRLKTLARPLEAFLDGFPRRYLKTHTADEITSHLNLFERLKVRLDAGDARAAEARLRQAGGHWELTVLTKDRPRLFADLTGTLSAWGMNILKTEAFSNSAGVVLDSFVFADMFQTLELNPEEHSRFLQSIEDAVSHRRAPERDPRERARRGLASRIQAFVPTEVTIDNSCSTHSTVLELVTRDRPGLLHMVSDLFAQAECSIEVALVETQGHRAIDVFYLRHAGEKLPDDKATALREALVSRFEAPAME